MNETAREVLKKLTGMGIGWELLEHQTAATMEECRLLESSLCAMIPKNIFLTPRNESAFYLLIASRDAKFRTADISKQLGVSRLSFAPEDRQFEFLRTYPGAITPLGLLFDERRAVKLAIDSALKNEPRLAFHPCDNTASVAITNEDFFGNFLPKLGYLPEYVEVHDFLEG
jgi:Ala-tRNA(Pro) deacylase